MTNKSGFGTIRRGRSGRYQARVRVRGHQVGIGAFDTRREAAQALARFAADQGSHASIDRKAARRALGDFAEVWWQTRSWHRPSTRLRDRQALDRDVLPFFGAAPLGRLTRADVQQWVDELAARMAPATVRRTYTVLDQILTGAVERGMLPANPARGVKLPRLVQLEASFLTTAELERLADAIDGRYRAMVLTMAWGTLRIGEAAGLRRVDVDIAAGSIRVANNVVQVRYRPVEGPPKTKAGRRSMTLPASVVAELAVHLDCQPGRNYVFGPNGDRPLLASEWRLHVWRKAVAAAGLKPLRPHDLKHTGVALLAAAGVEPSEIARRAGHSSVAFTYDRYGHLFPEIDKQAAVKLDELRKRHGGEG
jgi:integrase